MNEKTPVRLQKYLAEYGKKYPEAWKQYQIFRAGRGKDLPNWPDWCWCPLAAAYAIISGGGPNKITFESGMEIGILGALAAWRMTQGIYRFDTDLFAALWSTKFDGDLPVDVLYYLPEWCVYVEAPEGYKWLNSTLYGWYTYLEWDVNENRAELRFVIDSEERLWPYAIHLDKTNLIDSIDASFKTSQMNALREFLIEIPEISGYNEEMTKNIAPLISVSLYICSQAADISDMRGYQERPGNPCPTKTKQGMRIFPASNPTVWLTGYRIGASLRMTKELSASSEQGTHASPRPHIRKAHWHLFWTGPKSEKQKPLVKWLPPIPVGSNEEIVTTIHPVQ